jgi:hypothetical protein
MSSTWNRPQLKSGVDLQLQSAFNDSNWNVVVRLAEKRAKTLNDQYYEVRLHHQSRRVCAGVASKTCSFTWFSLTGCTRL